MELRSRESELHRAPKTGRFDRVSRGLCISRFLDLPKVSLGTIPSTMHLTSGVRFRHRFMDVLILPGSDERAAGFGEDRFVRWSPPIFTPLRSDLSGGIQCSFHQRGVRLVGTDGCLLVIGSTGQSHGTAFQRVSPPPSDPARVVSLLASLQWLRRIPRLNAPHPLPSPRRIERDFPKQNPACNRFGVRVARKAG